MLNFLIILAIFVAVIIGYKTGFNTGFFAIVFAYLIGGFVMGMTPKDIIGGWPVSTIFVLQLCFIQWDTGKNGSLSALCISQISGASSICPLCSKCGNCCSRSRILHSYGLYGTTYTFNL